MFVVDAVGYEEIILKQYEKSHQLFLVLSLCYVSIYSNLLSILATIYDLEKMRILCCGSYQCLKLQKWIFSIYFAVPSIY